MSNPIDTRNIAPSTIRRVNARTDREELNGEGRTAHSPRKKPEHADEPLAFDKGIAVAGHEAEEVLQQLNAAVSLLQALLARLDAIEALAQTEGSPNNVQRALEAPFFQSYALPTGSDKPIPIPIRIEAGALAEPYMITLRPVDVQPILDGDLTALQGAREEYVAHHDWVSEALVAHLPAPSHGPVADTEVAASQVSEELAACEQAPWVTGRLKNATRLLHGGPKT